MSQSSPPSPPPFADARTAWVLSDGTKGMEVQSLGLAERMGLEARLISIDAKSFWLGKLAHLARLPYWPMPKSMREAAIENGWPDVVITTGRRMAGFSILARRNSPKSCRTIHIQNPKIPPQYFDFMILPSHESVRADNILITTGALNRLSEGGIATAAANLPDIITHLPRPMIAFMLGGSNRRYSVGWQDYCALGQFAATLAQTIGTSLVFIASRRSLKTAGEAIRSGINNHPHSPGFYIWDGEGDNPYPGILGIADAVVVTSDSVNMTSEACFSGKPVFTYDFRPPAGRLALFHRIMQEGGYTQSVHKLAPYGFPPPAGAMLDEAGRIAYLLKGHNP